MIKPQELPVYQQKDRILTMLSLHQVIVIESPTGSGKTTQIPLILHEAGYAQSGIIGITQPRRIAALSVSEYIAKQIGAKIPGMVGYKMRFEDKTDSTTRIKVMTDGILLQELKLDPWLSKYSVIMVDEAHERSLNIDFILGLLKRILKQRAEFKVIVSSATINTEMFSTYFDGCPVVKIDAVTYPVTVIYDPPAIPAGKSERGNSQLAEELLLSKVCNTVERILDENRNGDILIFMPGEKMIRNCMERLVYSPLSRKLHVLPLYGRLSKEEQERVFDPTPFGKHKVVIATNIAETSITINGITSVIDSGLVKMNYYSPHTYTSSLNETTVSKASCNQRRGRAGRTQEGTCYRLYSREDFAERPMYTTEEIYRTDLSEVVLRMSELGITDFEHFDFISPPGTEGIRGAVQTLKLLDSLEDDNTLSSVGNMMARFPLAPRQSRMIAEAILSYPSVIEEVVIAASFLSAQSPYLFPAGEETEARLARRKFKDRFGDFAGFLNTYRAYIKAAETPKAAKKFCAINYLDERVMAEIANIKEQLELTVSQIGIPVTGGGAITDYLCCIARGMIQFVCIKDGRESYRSLTAERIQIHPGSAMFRENPSFIVAGEIVRTTRMFAMSVSPLTADMIERIQPGLQNKLKRGSGILHQNQDYADNRHDKNRKKPETKQSDATIKIGSTYFPIKKVKGKKTVTLTCADIIKELDTFKTLDTDQFKGLAGEITVNGYTLMEGSKLLLIMQILPLLRLELGIRDTWPKKDHFNLEETPASLIKSLDFVMNIAIAKEKTHQLGFIVLLTDGKGNFWYSCSRGFHTALNESLASLTALIDQWADNFTHEQKTKVNDVYRMLNNFYKE